MSSDLPDGFAMAGAGAGCLATGAFAALNFAMSGGE